MFARARPLLDVLLGLGSGALLNLFSVGRPELLGLALDVAVLPIIRRMSFADQLRGKSLQIWLQPQAQTLQPRCLAWLGMPALLIAIKRGSGHACCRTCCGDAI